VGRDDRIKCLGCSATNGGVVFRTGYCDNCLEKNEQFEEERDNCLKKNEQFEEERSLQILSDEKLNVQPNVANLDKHDDDDRTCVICLDAIKNVVFLPCRHLCACSKCALHVSKSSKLCPVCRTSIQTHIEVFL